MYPRTAQLVRECCKSELLGDLQPTEALVSTPLASQVPITQRKVVYLPRPLPSIRQQPSPIGDSGEMNAEEIYSNPAIETLASQVSVTRRW